MGRRRHTPEQIITALREPRRDVDSREPGGPLRAAPAVSGVC